MESLEEKFVAELVEIEPDLEQLLREHLADFDELLPHLFFGDVSRWICEQVKTEGSHEHLAPFFAKLEDGFGDGKSDVSNLIAASFVDNIFDVPEVVALLGPKLTRNYKVYIGEDHYRPDELQPMPPAMAEIIARRGERKKHHWSVFRRRR